MMPTQLFDRWEHSNYLQDQTLKVIEHINIEKQAV